VGTPTDPRATREPSPAPQVVIYLPLEGHCRVVVDAARDGDFARLHDWLTNKPRLHGLVVDAVEISLRERAA